MNPSAIFSKTGKGVQEASGKTSHLSRGDRAVLAAIDGKTSLGEVQKKFEKLAGPKFEALIQQLDKDGFIREVSSGVATSAAPASRAPAARGAAPAGRAAPPPAADDGEELDFTQAVKLPPKAPPSRAPQVDLAAAARAEAERKAKEQQAFDYKARQEAEARAKADAEAKAKAEAEARSRAKAEAEARARAEAEARTRAETEAKARAEAEAKARAETEAKVKAAREAAVRLATEAKAKADAEARAAAELKGKLEEERRAREDAERRAREAAEQARKEAEEKAKRDAEELRQRLEAEMRAKLEEERRAREEEDRRRREEEERRRREEDERRAKEEAERRAREEAERKRREEEERKRREEEERRRKEEEERRAKEEAERKAREEAERKRREEEERRRREDEERRAKEEAERKAREERERKEKEEAEAKAREERERREREDRERREREEAERRARDERERREREERERREREDAERKAREERGRREKEEAETKAREERERREREDRERREKEEAGAKEKQAPPAAAGGFDDSLLADLDSFTQRDEQARREKEEAERRAKQETERKAKEEAERQAREAEEKKRREQEDRRREEEKRAREETEQREREEEEQREREDEERREREKEEAERRRKAKEAERKNAEKAARKPATGDEVEVGDEDLDMDDIKRDEKALSGEARRAAREREELRSMATTARAGRPKKWGKPAAIGLFVLLVGGLGVLQVMPLSTSDYEKAASEAFGAPVKIASAHLSLLTGVELKLERVTIGDAVKIGSVRASPEIGSLFGAKKAFGKVELEGVSLTQGQLGAALFGKLGGDGMRIGRVLARQVKFDGPLPLPALDADAVIAGDGTLQSLTLQGGDKMVVRIAPRGGELGFEIAAGGFTVPFVPALTFTDFNMKGTATRQGVTQSEFDGRLYEGVLAGTMRVRWGPTWSVEGELRPQGLRAGVFAPALVSEGKVDGRGAYSMSGSSPASLFESARIQGDFKVTQGVLGSFDVSRAMQTGGSQTQGRTVFHELSAQGIYDKGAVQIRNAAMAEGALNVGASLDIAPGGALTGRIAADIKTPAQTLRGVFAISGSTQDPVIRK